MLCIITLILLYSLEEYAKSTKSKLEANYQTFIDETMKF